VVDYHYPIIIEEDIQLVDYSEDIISEDSIFVKPQVDPLSVLY
jgi:hypothetical protein